jgi:hypothetical protein
MKFYLIKILKNTLSLFSELKKPGEDCLDKTVYVENLIRFELVL